MSLSSNQKLTIGIACLGLIISSGSAIFSYFQFQSQSYDQKLRCNDTLAQLQSDISTKNDALLSVAMIVKLDSKHTNEQLDNVLMDYRRILNLFDKKRICSEIVGKKIIKEIDEVRESVINHNDFKLNVLIEAGKTLAQDQNIYSKCCP